jgi:general secretion pathway protein D
MLQLATACQQIEHQSFFDIPRRPVSDDGKWRPFGPYAMLPDPSGNAAPGQAIAVRGSGEFMSNEPRSAFQALQQNADGQVYTLNLVESSVAEASKAVLGDIFGVNYTVAPRLEGRVTLQTTKPTSRDGIADLFIAALRSVGAAVVQNGSIYQVVSADQAAASATMGFGDNSDPSALGSSVKVVPLKYVAATEMKRILEPVASVGGVIQVDQARNALMLGGTDREIASMQETIAIFDVNVMRGMSFAVVPVRAGDPDAMVEDLNNIFATNKEGPMSGMVQFVGNKRSRSVLIISKQPQYLTEAQNWVRRLDEQAAGPRRQFYTYALRNRQAKEVVEVLNAMFANETVDEPDAAPRFNRPEGEPLAPPPGAFPQASAASSSSGTGMSLPNFNGVLSQAFGGPDSRANGFGPPGSSATEFGSGGAKGSPRIKIVADESQNTLLVLASLSDYKRVERVIANLDVVPNQVLIEATIAEVTLTDALRFGVRWFVQGQQGKHTGIFSDLVSGAIGTAFPGFSYLFKTGLTQVTLNALNDVTNVNVLASPSLMVLDRKTATLQIGDQVPITTQTAIGVLTPGAPIVNSVAYKDTGVILSVTPRINEAGRVLLDIEQEVSTVSRTNTSNIDSPTIGRRRIKTTVIVNNGEGIALGGLIQDRVIQKAAQVPVLGDIPIFGNAFRDKENSVEKTELLIMLTPRVVRDLNEAQAVTEEYRSKVGAFAPRPRSPVHKVGRNAARVVE